jgi:hypothetical protein
MKRLAWIFRGPLANGQFQEMEEADLERAVAEGWAQDVQRTGSGMTPSTSFKPVEPGPHEAAERYATRVGTYQTRLMEPTSAGPAPPVPQQPATIDPQPEPPPPPVDPRKDVRPAPSSPPSQKPVTAARATPKKTAKK